MEVTASVTANWGALVTGSLSTVLCNDTDYTLTIYLRQPSCLGLPDGTIAAQYRLFGAKLTTQASTLNYSDITSPLTLSFTTTLGGPNDGAHNLTMSGISYAAP